MTVELTTIALDSSSHISCLELNRPEASNALDQSMIDALNKHLEKISQDEACRLLILRGRGKNFCAGADLSWMRECGAQNFPENLKSSNILAAMFAKLHHLSIPTLALVNGAAYGGAVGLIAACDFAIASDSSRFCLSEVKWGILPAIILPYLQKKMRTGDLRRLALSAKVFDATEAKENGLVQVLTSSDNLLLRACEEINLLLAGGPNAQKSFKQLFDLLELNQNDMSATVSFIAKARTSHEGQEGLNAFIGKATPSWVKKLKTLDLKS